MYSNIYISIHVYMLFEMNYHLLLAAMLQRYRSQRHMNIVRLWCFCINKCHTHWSDPVPPLIVSTPSSTFDRVSTGRINQSRAEANATIHWYVLRARFMVPPWGPPGADRTQVGSMLAPYILLEDHFSDIYQSLHISHAQYHIEHVQIKCQSDIIKGLILLFTTHINKHWWVVDNLA